MSTPSNDNEKEEEAPKTQGEIMFGVDEDSINSFKGDDDDDNDNDADDNDQKVSATVVMVDTAGALLEEDKQQPPSQGDLLQGVEEESLASFEAGDSYGTGLSTAPIYLATVSAPTNIAVVKYWGKANVQYNTPINDSLSVTLDQEDLKAVTTVAASTQFKVDRLWLNGDEDHTAATNKRFRACIDGVKALATDKIDETSGSVLITKAQWQNDINIHVSSYNTFPTAAGLASSAAGYAALVAALAKLMGAKEQFPGQLTTIARQGSGSSCRSLYGGFVAWRMGGEKPDFSDSFGQQVADETSWPQMRAVIMVVSDAKKDTSSTTGMGTSVATSALLAHRAKTVVPSVMEAMEKAILAQDFDSFGKLTMQDSNQFHAVCMDTYPPIFYMNDISRRIVRLVHAYNDWSSKHSGGAIRAAYTFDAGPNAVLYTLDKYAVELGALMLRYFPAGCSDVASYIKHASFASDVEMHTLDPSLLEHASKVMGDPAEEGDVKMVYYTKPGPGPQDMDDLEDSNLDPRTGLNTYAVQHK